VEFATKADRLDVLMCNAGVMAVPAGTTKDGCEIQFGTNHLGHAMLIKMLLPVLEQTAAIAGADVRIMCNTSPGYLGAPGPGVIFQDLKVKQDLGIGGRWRRYGQSKLANVLHVMELANRYPKITSLVIHPGVIKTELAIDLGFFDRLLVDVTNIHNILTPEQGASNQLWAATTSKDNVQSGTFYEPVGNVGKRSKHFDDDKLRMKLWEWTQSSLRTILISPCWS
jgi:NAD(P)-dependent dehydrogenase (short-subunit alcohol dehydrogenase family)